MVGGEDRLEDLEGMLRPSPVTAPFEELTKHGSGEKKNFLNQSIKSMLLSFAPELPGNDLLSSEFDKFGDS